MKKGGCDTMEIKLIVDVCEFPDDDDPNYDDILVEVIKDAVNNGCFEIVE